MSDVETTNGLKIYVLEVGQGDSLLIRLPSGGFGLIDCNRRAGDKVSPALDALQREGLSELEFVVLTHLDLDHYNGLGDLLDYFSADGRRVKRFWISGAIDPKILRAMIENIESEYPTEDSTRKKKRLQRCHIELRKLVRWLSDRSPEIETGEVEYEPLYGPREIKILDEQVHAYCLSPLGASHLLTELEAAEWVAGEKNGVGKSNDVSAILLFSYGETRLLFGGDAPVSVWDRAISAYKNEANARKWPGLKSHFVKVSHHGSKGSSSIELWREVGHEGSAAAISAGVHRSYDHPDEATLSQISGVSRGVRIYCTRLATACREPRSGVGKSSVIPKNRSYALRLGMRAKAAPGPSHQSLRQ